MAHVTNDKLQVFEDQLVNTLVEALEKNNAPWMQPWRPTMDMPHNGVSGRHYSRQNMLLLEATATAKGYEDPRWMTFEQIKKMGGRVKKGEKGVMINASTIQEVPDEKAREAGDSEAVKKIFISKFYHVFNAEQTEGIEPYKKKECEHDASFKVCEAAEATLRESGAKIEHRPSNAAFYNVSADKIVLPDKSQFVSEEGYYAVALHELSHWTGHNSRLNRDMSGGFGSENYAKEELCAEISSYFLSRKLGIEFDPSNHAAYIEGWKKIIKNEPEVLKNAISKAHEINAFLEKKCQSLSKAVSKRLVNKEAPAPGINKLEKQQSVIDMARSKIKENNSRMQSQTQRLKTLVVDGEQMLNLLKFPDIKEASKAAMKKEIEI